MRSLKILICSGILFLTGVSAVLAMGSTGMIQDTLVGKPAADFTLSTVKGNKVNLTKYRDGKKAVIFIWATWCPHCREELKHANDLQKKLESQGIKMILISLGEDKNTVQNYLERHHYDFDVLLDEDQTLEGPYHLIGVPTLFFVNEHGVIKLEDHAFPDNYEEAFK
jgi:peroxiredoxin